MGSTKKGIKIVLAILNTIFAGFLGLASQVFHRGPSFGVVVVVFWTFVVWWWALNERKVQVTPSTSQVPITSPARKIFDFRNVLNMLMYLATLLVAYSFVYLFITFLISRY